MDSDAGGRRGDADAAYYPGVVERIGFFNERPRWMAYLVTLVLSLTAIGLRRWLDMLDADLAPFTLFYPVVFACALIGGVGAGAVSLIMLGFAATMFWLEPRGVMSVSPTGAIDIVLFTLSNGVLIGVAYLLRTSYRNLHRSEARLSLSQDVGQIGIWEVDLKTGALWWSPSFYKLIGIDPAMPPDTAAVLARIHPADREQAEAAFEAAREGRGRLDVEFRFNRDDGVTIWLAGRAELFRDAQGRPARLLGVNFDATPMRTIQTERDHANAMLQTFFDCIPGAAYAKDLEGRALLGNPGFVEAVGCGPDDFLGKNDFELVRDEELARKIRAHDEAVLAAGVPHQLEEDLRLPDGSISHWLSIKTPFRDAEGKVAGIVGISLDVTERRRAEQRSRLLADEVDHRAKNLLGVVQSIVRLTRVDDVAAFKAVLTGRIRALARAHSLLAASRWEGVDLARLVREELAPFDRVGVEQVTIAGPSLTLCPGASQALAMVLHELAINAARYGALSTEQGRLTVAWRTEEPEGARGASLALTWAERGGPPVVAPTQPGFGFTTIHGAIEHQLGGSIAFDWAVSGVECRIAFPAAGNVVTDQGAPAPSPAPSSGGPGPAPVPPALPAAHPVDLAGRRVLIVDDEALIALMLADSVRDLGCGVLGPAHSAQEAVALIRQAPPDLAILDINLAGTSNAPVASALKALGIPFVYCTGYAEPAGQIEAGLQAETITKPTDPELLAAALRRAAERTPA